MADNHQIETDKPHRRTLFQWLRHAFFAGILVTMPFLATFLIALWLIDIIDSRVLPLLPADWSVVEIIDLIPGSGVIILIISLTVIGGLTGGFIGHILINFLERLLAKTPLRVLYNTVKQILQTILQGQNKAFKKPAMIEYPRKGIWAVGFITNEQSDDRLEDAIGVKEDMISLFVPTTPNPTSGFLLFFPKEDVYPLDMSVEEAIKLVISAGIISKNDDNQSRIRTKPPVKKRK